MAKLTPSPRAAKPTPPRKDDDPRNLLDMLVRRFTAPKERDGQITIGPSGLGDPCDFCVGQQMSWKLPGAQLPAPVPSGLKSILGTGEHFYMEHLTVGPEWDAIGFVPEMPKVYVGTIEGYGDIKGTIDAYAEKYATITDYKFPGIKKIKSYRTNGIPTVYSYQRQLYGRAVELLGKPVKHVSNLFIPIDSNNPDDIWYDIEPYDRAAAEAALDRAQIIWTDYVVPGRLKELASDEDCYACSGFNAPIRELVFKK